MFADEQGEFYPMYLQGRVLFSQEQYDRADFCNSHCYVMAHDRERYANYEAASIDNGILYNDKLVEECYLLDGKYCHVLNLLYLTLFVDQQWIKEHVFERDPELRSLQEKKGRWKITHKDCTLIQGSRLYDKTDREKAVKEMKMVRKFLLSETNRFIEFILHRNRAKES